MVADSEYSIAAHTTQDSGGLPTRGTKVEGSAGYSFRNVSYPYFNNHFSAFHPVGRLTTVFATNQVDTSMGRKLDYFEQFTAGGMSQLTAYRYQEFHANTLVLSSSGLILRQPSVHHPIHSPGLAAWYEAGRFDMGSAGWLTHQSISTGIFVPIPLGIACVNFSVDESGKERFRVLIGSF